MVSHSPTGLLDFIPSTMETVNKMEKSESLSDEQRKYFKKLDRLSVIRIRHVHSLINHILWPRFWYRNSGLNILDVGCQTGKSTNVIAQRFPNCMVFGIDSNPNMIRYAQLCYSGSATFACVDISRLDFVDQLAQVLPNFSAPYFDLIISTHLFQLSSSKMEITFANICKILKPNGSLHATFSFWSDLFQIGHELASEMFDDIKSHSGKWAGIHISKPVWSDDIHRLKHLLAQNQFGTQPEIVFLSNTIRFHTLKKIQDCIRFIYPLSSMIPESKRLEFFSRFFERFYDEYFTSCYEHLKMKRGDQQDSTAKYCLNYQYLFVGTTKTVVPNADRRISWK